MLFQQTAQQEAARYLHDGADWSDAVDTTTTDTIADINCCIDALQRLNLEDVVRVFLANEFGITSLSPAANGVLAQRVAKTLEQRGLTISDCLG